MALLRITALPCESGAAYYRRAGRCFAVGQSEEIEVSAEDEALLRASKRLRVEAIEAEKPKAKGRKPKSAQVEDQGPSTDGSAEPAAESEPSDQ